MTEQEWLDPGSSDQVVFSDRMLAFVRGQPNLGRKRRFAEPPGGSGSRTRNDESGLAWWDDLQPGPPRPFRPRESGLHWWSVQGGSASAD
jgi:hypothetical protein